MDTQAIQPIPKQTTAILFDWGGVFNPQHEALAGYQSIATKYGHSAESLYSVLYSGPEWKEARIGRMSSDEYWAIMQHKLGVGGSSEDFLAALFAGETIDQTLVATARIVQKRYRVGLLSNALDNLESQLATQWNVADCFPVVINSARLGAAKPDERAFEAAITALETPREQVVFIDDKQRNVDAARAWGLPTLHYSTTPTLLQDLRDAKILTVPEYSQLSSL